MMMKIIVIIITLSVQVAVKLTGTMRGVRCILSFDGHLNYLTPSCISSITHFITVVWWALS